MVVNKSNQSNSPPHYLSLNSIPVANAPIINKEKKAAVDIKVKCNFRSIIDNNNVNMEHTEP